MSIDFGEINTTMKSLREYIDIVSEVEELDEFSISDIPGFASRAWAAWNFLKQHGIPMMTFAAIVALHGFASAVEATQQGESKFNRIANVALRRVNQDKLDRLVTQLNSWFSKIMSKYHLDDPLDMGDNIGPIIRDLAENKRRL